MSLHAIELEDDSKRHKDEEHHNDEGTVAPSPGGGFQERLGSQRSSEGSADEGRADEGECESSVAQAGGVGNKDVHDEVDGIVANPVQDVAGSVTVRAFALGQDDHADEIDGNKEGEAFSTTPKGEDLCNRQLDDATDDAGKNVGSGELRGSGEVGICS